MTEQPPPGRPNPDHPFQDSRPPQPNPADPWSGPAGTPPPPGPNPADHWPSPTTVIDFGAPIATDEAPPRGRRRTRLAVAVGTVVALLLGGAAFAGVRMWNGTGPQPEEAMPASVAAFARFDLAPGLGQGLKLNRVLGRFPKSETGEDAGQRLKAGLFQAVGIDDAEYRSHIEPWFGGRFGLGVWVDDQQRPYLLAAIASGDDGKAVQGLTALQRKRDTERFGFTVEDRWALVALGDHNAQDAAASATAEAGGSALADAAGFRGAVATLPDRQPVLAWVDLDRVADVLRQAVPTGFLPPSVALLTGGEPGPLGSAMPGLQGMTGHIVLGAQATGDGIEVRVRSSDVGGRKPAGSTANLLAQLADQPGNSAIAAVIALPKFDQATLDLLDQSFNPMQPGDLPPDVAAELAKDPEFAQAQAKATALSDALRALSGAALTFAMTDMQASALRATAQLTDAQLAGSLAEMLGQVDGSLNVNREGDRVELQTRGFAPEGRLADSALYQDTMAGLPDQSVAVAAYLDIQRIVEQSRAGEQDRRQIAPWKSVGLVSGYDGEDAVFMLRAVIR